ncbi:unnamed protein product, partial [Heterosigma akashiwo]
PKPAVNDEAQTPNQALTTQAGFEEDARIYEYSSAANPSVPRVPVLSFPAEHHQTGSSRIIPFNLNSQLGLPYAATSQNLLASYIRICERESVNSHAVATSQCFYIIRGAGRTDSEHGTIDWSDGDLFVLPATSEAAVHHAAADSAIYWISDEPLMKYLGVAPSEKKFCPTVFRKQRLLAEVETLKHGRNEPHRNRLGVLLGNKATEDGTKTLTHVLWSLLNTVPGHTAQRPHRHNSVALDFCVSAPAGGKVYTLMGPELDADGWVKDPIRMDWATGGAFTTPPGWWHSHHNESGEAAWVLPVQDAGLLTHQGVLDIRFS